MDLMMYSHLKQVIKVRAIHYDSVRGIFLIKTPKSGRANAWTTPGGELLDGEDNIEGLQRLVNLDVGVEMAKSDPTHFHVSNYNFKGEFVTTYAHFVDINTRFTKDGIEGITPTRLPYRFATLKELMIGSIRTTRTISEMVKEGTILERIRAMNRNRPIFV